MSPTAGRDAWDARYRAAAEQAGTVWSAGPNATLAAILADVKPGSAVDLGCGEGRNAVWLTARGWTVTAVDFSAVGLETGRRRAAAAGVDVEWVQADVTEWAVPAGVDLVLLAYLQLPTARLVPILRRAAAALAPGGLLLVIGHDRDNLARGVGGPQDPQLLHTVADLRAGSEGLTIERCEQLERPVEGADRPAIDTLLLARRC